MEKVYGRISLDELKQLQTELSSAILRQDLIEKVVNIPDNATNGDVINALFSDIGIIQTNPYTGIIEIDLDWWNAPYKEGAR